MTRQALWWRCGIGALALGAVLAYVHDPPWLGRVTSGFGSWERDPSGTRFRWTGGRASFFIPADAKSVEVPLRALFLASDARPFIIDVAVDDRRVAQVVLSDERWTSAKVRVPTSRTRRRFRRVDLHVNRTWSDRSLGVQVGEVMLQRGTR